MSESGKHMRNGSQRTLIGQIREVVRVWRVRQGWSRETLVMALVEAHIRLGAEDLTGIRFDPPTRDTYERAKVNADRVQRWLDDDTKDNALMPANFLPSIIEALPLDLLLQLLNELLQHRGLAVHPIANGGRGELCVVSALGVVLKEDGESHQALTGLIGNDSQDALTRARTELTESIAAQQAVLQAVEQALTATTGEHT